LEKYDIWYHFSFTFVEIGISALGGLAIGGALFKFHYMKHFVKCQPNRALIIYSKYEGHKHDNGVLNNAYAGEGNGTIYQRISF
jgi:hypothetical protein